MILFYISVFSTDKVSSTEDPVISKKRFPSDFVNWDNALPWGACLGHFVSVQRECNASNTIYVCNCNGLNISRNCSGES